MENMEKESGQLLLMVPERSVFQTWICGNFSLKI